MDVSTVATIVSVIGTAVVNLVVIVWRASSLSMSVATLDARLARIEGHEETRSEQRGQLLERISRLETKVGLTHPLHAGD